MTPRTWPPRIGSTLYELPHSAEPETQNKHNEPDKPIDQVLGCTARYPTPRPVLFRNKESPLHPA